MIPVSIAVAEFICIIILVVYAMIDNERLYSAVFAAILASILSGLVGYQLLFGLIQTDASTRYTDQPLGYFFIMVAIMVFLITLAVVVDGIMKKKEKKRNGVGS